MACASSGLLESSSRRFRVMASVTMEGAAIPCSFHFPLATRARTWALISGRTTRRLTHAYGEFKPSDARRRHSAASDFHLIPGNHAGSAFTASHAYEKKTIERHPIEQQQPTKRKRCAQRKYFRPRGDTEKDVCSALYRRHKGLFPLHVVPVRHLHDHGCREPVHECEYHTPEV